MSSYHAINIRFKLRKDAPDFVKAFLNTWLFETDAEQAVKDLDQVEQVTGLNALKYYPEGVGDLTSMVAQRSTYHNSWCWRVAEDKGDYTLYESKASCKNTSFDMDLIVLVLSGLSPFLVVDDGDILARVIYESASGEDVVVYDKAAGHCTQTSGYLHKWSDNTGYGDGSHPRESSDYYNDIIADGEGVNCLTRLVPEDREFYPPWNIAEVVALNNENKAEWDEERSAQWWG